MIGMSAASFGPPVDGDTLGQFVLQVKDHLSYFLSTAKTRWEARLCAGTLGPPSGSLFQFSQHVDLRWAVPVACKQP